MSSRISVCIPCYNAGEYLSETLDSLINQTYPNFEIIIVNDGSNDQSGKILERYNHIANIYETQNCGAASARNLAFRKSVGQFILFLDADDIISPQHLERLVEKIDGPRSVATSPWARFYGDPDTAIFSEFYIDQTLSGPEWLVRCWSSASGVMMAQGMFLYPRLLLEENGGWDERLSLIEDFEFNARMISASPRISFAPEARLFYRSGLPASVSHQDSRTAVTSQHLSLMLGTSHLLAAEDSPRTRRVCANLLQAFEYQHYPRHADLRRSIRARVAELGGADLVPCGPPGFHKLRRWVGWKAARRFQHAAESLHLNSVSRK